MAEKGTREDKRVYNYTQSLNQPHWIQRITDDFSLPNAIRLSTVFWFLVFLGILLLVSNVLSKQIGLPFPLLASLSAFVSWSLSVIVSDLKIEEKGWLRFLVDYFWFYWKFGRKAKRTYYNKGYLYRKVKTVEKKKGERIERF